MVTNVRAAYNLALSHSRLQSPAFHPNPLPELTVTLLQYWGARVWAQGYLNPNTVYPLHFLKEYYWQFSLCIYECSKLKAMC
jgi:hypothetical protein